MIKNDRVYGVPLVQYKDTKANITALSGVGEGAIAYATDTNEFGSYDGATWTWGQGGSFDLAATIHAATEETSLHADDEVGIWEHVSGLLRKVKFSTWVTDLGAYFVSHSSSTASNDFLVGSGSGAWIKKTLAQTITILRTSLDSVYAVLSHTHAASDITSGTIAEARLPSIFRPNDLLNGDFSYFQRVNPASAITMTDKAYNGPDRWYSLIQGSGATINRSTGIGTSRYSCKIIAGGTTNRYGIAQIINAKRSIALRNKTVTAQIRIKPVNNAGSGTRDYRIAILEWTGTADSVQMELVSNWASSTYTTADFFDSTTKTLVGTAMVTATHNTEAVLSVSGTVSSSCNNLFVFVWCEDVPTHASDYVLMSEAGSHESSVVQSWRPTENDFALCQEYCQKSYSVDDAPGTVTYTGAPYNFSNSTYPTVNVFFPVWLRIAPTSITVYGPMTGASGKMRIDSGDVNATVAGSGQNYFAVYPTSAVTSAAHDAQVHFLVDVELGIP